MTRYQINMLSSTKEKTLVPLKTNNERKIGEKFVNETDNAILKDSNTLPSSTFDLVKACLISIHFILLCTEVFLSSKHYLEVI